MSILDQLEGKEQFTHIEEGISDYLLAHREEMYEMNLATLAEASYSSNATIVRLCRKLGFKGFKDFKIAFVAELEKQRREKRNVDFDKPFDETQSVQDVIKSATDLMKEAVDICYASVSTSSLVRAAEWISRAKHLYLYGAGDSYISGLSFANQLIKLGISVIHPMHYSESIAVSTTATASDVALILTYSGGVAQALSKELKILHRSGCKVILITSDTSDYNVNLTIRFPSKEGKVGKISVFYSQSCFHWILNCLYGLIFTKNYHRNMDIKTEYDSIVDGFQR